MAAAVYPSALRYVNIGKESVPGTPVTGTATLPVTDPDPEDQPTWFTDEALRFAMAAEYGLVQGPVQASLRMAGPVYADTFGHLVLNILGDQAVAGSGPFTHTFSVLNSGAGQPPTHTLIDRTGIPATGRARQYPYSCLSQLTITGDAQQLLVWQASVTSYLSSVPGAPPVTHLSSVAASAAWASTVTLGGVPVADLAGWEVSINREIDPFWSSTGVQQPGSIWRGAVTVSGRLTFAPAVDETPLTTMLSNAQPALQIVASAPAGASLTLHCQKAAYDTSKVNASGALFGYDVTFRGIANTTDVGASGGYSPIKATLVNSVSGSY